MKANEAPEKLYLHPTAKGKVGASWLTFPLTNEDVEYIRTDAFIEKACEFWKDHLAGYDICEDDIERSVESFKLAMKL
jgi:hypothetical protein